MASIRILKNRIKSAKNISQITKAMEMVAASKMKKAQTLALCGKLYATKIADMVIELSSRIDVSTHPLLKKPDVLHGKRLIILISTNKGLCGGLNTNLFRNFVKSYPHPKQHDYITIGKKGADLIVRFGGTLLADFSQTVPFVDAVPAIIEEATKKYLSGVYEGVDVLFSEFFSALRQAPMKKTLLPLSISGVDTQKEQDTREFLIEPNPKDVLDFLLPHYIENQLRDAILEGEASEHSARMVAMRNATDNAVTLIGDLTLMYNKVRQEKITYEISDMVTARLAVE
jgi:F-type H+-transporting ATPase subunit gamma